MAKTILKVRQGEVAFYLNETSAGASNGGRRFALSRTSAHGSAKDGWVRINSTEHQALLDVGDDDAQFGACVAAFNSKKVRNHVHHGGIRGMAGKWEGVAFPARKSVILIATQNTHNESVSPI